MPDLSNQELKNARLHNVDGSIVDADDLPLRRGLPGIGKICECVVTGGGMTAGNSYKCLDVEPFPLRNGGGTWIEWGGGSGGGYGPWQPFTTTVTQGDVEFTHTGGGLLRTDGLEAQGMLAIDITGVASGTYPGDADGQTILITGHSIDATLAADFFRHLPQGVIDSGDPQYGYTLTRLVSGVTTTQLFAVPGSTDIGLAHTLEVGDRLFWDLHFMCSDDI